MAEVLALFGSYSVRSCGIPSVRILLKQGAESLMDRHDHDFCFRKHIAISSQNSCLCERYSVLSKETLDRIRKRTSFFRQLLGRRSILPWPTVILGDALFDALVYRILVFSLTNELCSDFFLNTRTLKLYFEIQY